MNNSTEFEDVTKPIQTEDLAKINASGGNNENPQDSKSLNKNNANGDNRVGSNDLTEGETSLTGDIDATDIMSYGGLKFNAKYFERVQDISDHCFNGLRVPFCSDNFRRIQIPKSRDGVPVVPYDTYISDPTLNGGGAAFFTDWLNTNEQTAFQDLYDDDTNFTVKMDSKTKAKLMTLVSIWSNEYLDKGVRDSRARPSAVLGDWGWALGPEFSMTTRNIRTDLHATWMYGNYTPLSPVADITVIDAQDLRTFMNTTGGNYWPVEQTTPCLALGKTATNDLGKLGLLNHNVFIDFDSSMANRNLNQINHNGCPAYSVPLNVAVNSNDPDVARILNNTFSAIDTQWAIFCNTLPLCAKVDQMIATSGVNSQFYLRVYSNSISDQFINFYATHRNPNHNSLPVDSTRLTEFIQAWRFYKTMCVDRVLAEIGSFGQIANSNTYGKVITAQNFFDVWSCCFEFKSTNANFTGSYRPLWIPYEMWIQNGANIKLDYEDYVDGESGVLVNKNYLCPRSQVMCNLTQWAGTGTINNIDYYMPNSSLRATGTQGGLNYTQGTCLPSTLPFYQSTTETMTLPWIKSTTIDFTYSNCGKNSNSIYRKKLVFTEATKN